MTNIQVKKKYSFNKKTDPNFPTLFYLQDIFSYEFLKLFLHNAGEVEPVIPHLQNILLKIFPLKYTSLFT